MGVHAFHLDEIIRTYRQTIQKQSQLIAGTAVSCVEIGMCASDITNSSVSQIVQIIGSLSAGLEIIVIDANRLIGKISSFSDDDVHQSVLAQVIDDNIIRQGI